MNEEVSVKIPLEPYVEEKQVEEDKKPSVFSKEFYKRWKEGMKQITPLQQLQAKKIGHLGAIIGLSLALGVLTYRTITNFNWFQLGFAIFLFFIIWLQGVEFIGAKQKYESMKDIIKQMEVQNEKEF